MQLNPSEISELIKSRIQNLDAGAQMRTQGTVVSVTDGICRIHGLSDVMQGEMLEFPKNTFGLALNLERDSVGAVILGEYQHHRGRHGQDHRQDPVGADRPGSSGAWSIRSASRSTARADQRQGDRRHREGRAGRGGASRVAPVQTGLKAIDSMVPVGRGQRRAHHRRPPDRQDRGRGRYHHQPEGQGPLLRLRRDRAEGSTIANVVRKLEEHGAMAYTIIVASPASESAAMQYIAPYSGCTMGEYFRDRGQDALIIYDDLTKQAWAYRQVSLLLRRPPGREAIRATCSTCTRACSSAARA